MSLFWKLVVVGFITDFMHRIWFEMLLLFSVAPVFRAYGGISSSDCCGIKESANINISHSQASLNWPLHMLPESENIHDESGNFCFLSFFFFIWAVSSDPLSCVLCFVQRAPGRLLGGGALRVTPACSVAPPSVWQGRATNPFLICLHLVKQ